MSFRQLVAMAVSGGALTTCALVCRVRSCGAGPGPGRKLALPLGVALGVGLFAGSVPALAQRQVQPLPGKVLELSKPMPRTAAPPPGVTTPGRKPAATSPPAPTSQEAKGCNLTIGQMERVARGQVLRLGQGDCVMQFNTVR